MQASGAEDLDDLAPHITNSQGPTAHHSNPPCRHGRGFTPSLSLASTISHSSRHQTGRLHSHCVFWGRPIIQQKGICQAYDSGNSLEIPYVSSTPPKDSALQGLGKREHQCLMQLSALLQGVAHACRQKTVPDDHSDSLTNRLASSSRSLGLRLTDALAKMQSRTTIVCVTPLNCSPRRHNSAQGRFFVLCPSQYFTMLDTLPRLERRLNR
jgi:hypothetical protein